MQNLSNISKLLFLLLFVSVASCKKDDDSAPLDLTKFYRLKTFEVGVVPEERQVQVLFQVTDFEKKGVATLLADDFIVSENKGRIDTEAEIRLGRGSIPYALKNVLLLDISSSVEAFVPQIKAAAKSLIEKKLLSQEIAIYTFDAEVKQLIGFSTNSSALLAVVESIPESNLENSTNLYGAIKQVADLWEDAYLIDGIVDGSLVIFTDGRHNASQAQTLASAKAALGDKRVYIAALASPDLDEASLKTLAVVNERYFKADDTEGLEQMFLDIQNEIQSLSNSIYYLYYKSPISDPTPYQNELKIEVKENRNNGFDRYLIEQFNSDGFGN